MTTTRMLVFTACIAVLTGACAGKVYESAARPASELVVERTEPQTELYATLPVQLFSLHDLTPPSQTFTEHTTLGSCDIAAKIRETAFDPELAAAELSVGSQRHQYIEVRVESLRTYSDYEKDVALRVLDTETCETEVVVVRKTYTRDSKLVPVNTSAGRQLAERTVNVATLAVPSGWDIEVVRRVNGIEWNNWATQFQVIKPEGRIVVGVRYPIIRSSPSVVEYVTYVPFVQGLRRPEFVEEGIQFMEDMVAAAYEELRERNVPSRAVKGSLISDVAALRPEYIARLAPNEHMDPTEFFLDPQWTADRIHIIIGTNRERTAAHTCSKAAACGLMQFTAGTYDHMRRSYPTANLMPSFSEGARDPYNSVKAAILLHDNNLASLVNAFGTDILDDPRLEEYLTAAYNTGVARVINVLRIAQRRSIDEWTDARGRCSSSNRYLDCLLTETKHYIAKLRYLRDHWSEQVFALQP